MFTDTKRPILLLVNPNTNAATTTLMRDLAAEELANLDVEIVGLTAAEGPAMIVDPASLKLSETQVKGCVADFMAGPHGERVVAVIIAAIGDPGRAEINDELAVPVIGIGQASILAASKNGQKFGMATSTPLLAPSLTELVVSHGRSGSFVGVQLTDSGPLELASHPENQFLELRSAVDRSIEAGAGAVIIAGGPLSQTARRLAAERTALIVEPIPSAARLVREHLGL